MKICAVNRCGSKHEKLVQSHTFGECLSIAINNVNASSIHRLHSHYYCWRDGMGLEISTYGRVVMVAKTTIVTAMGTPQACGPSASTAPSTTVRTLITMKVALQHWHLHSVMAPRIPILVLPPLIFTGNVQRLIQELLLLHQRLPGCLHLHWKPSTYNS